MRTLIFTIVYLLAHTHMFATRQQPDILSYRGKELRLSTGWGHPSPLETYYLQAREPYPFSMLSTGNYRGHVATWEIKNGKLLLTRIAIEDSIIAPNELSVFTNMGEQVKAIWFNGVIRASFLNQYDDDEKDFDVIIQIRSGEVVKSVEYVGKEWAEYIVSDHESDAEKVQMFKMYWSYVSFYYRLKGEMIDLEGETCVLKVGSSKLSPIFCYYGNEFLNWPYNWENLSISGAPNSQWQIENDSIFLKGFTLKAGLSFSGPTLIEADLDSIGWSKNTSTRIFAEKVNGVYVILHGEFPQDNESPRMYEFEKTGYTILRIENGIVQEKYLLELGFDFDDPGDDTSTGLMNMILDY